MRFEENSILPEKLKTRFYPLKLDFLPLNSIFLQFFIPFWLTKLFEKRQKLQFLSINLENPYKWRKLFSKNNGETRFQTAETCFQYAKTPAFSLQGLWMDSAQKKPAGEGDKLDIMLTQENISWRVETGCVYWCLQTVPVSNYPAGESGDGGLAAHLVHRSVARNGVHH